MDLNELKQKLAQCERQQQQLWAYRPLSQETLKSLREYYRVGLTYTSNALEGNSLTESETKVVIEDGLTIEGKPLRDVYEAVGHAKAYDYLYDLSHDAPITEETIRAVHNVPVNIARYLFSSVAANMPLHLWRKSANECSN